VEYEYGFFLFWFMPLCCVILDTNEVLHSKNGFGGLEV
jgi:hypothetical protein